MASIRPKGPTARQLKPQRGRVAGMCCISRSWSGGQRRTGWRSPSSGRRFSVHERALVSKRSLWMRVEGTNGRRERGVAEIEGRDGERDVPSQDEDGEGYCAQLSSVQAAREGASKRTGKHVTHGKRYHHRRHEELVGRGIEDAAEDGTHVETPREPAVELCAQVQLPQSVPVLCHRRRAERTACNAPDPTRPQRTATPSRSPSPP